MLAASGNDSGNAGGSVDSTDDAVDIIRHIDVPLRIDCHEVGPAQSHVGSGQAVIVSSTGDCVDDLRGRLQSDQKRYDAGAEKSIAHCLTSTSGAKPGSIIFARSSAEAGLPPVTRPRRSNPVHRTAAVSAAATTSTTKQNGGHQRVLATNCGR